VADSFKRVEIRRPNVAVMPPRFGKGPQPLPLIKTSPRLGRSPHPAARPPNTHRRVASDAITSFNWLHPSLTSESLCALLFSFPRDTYSFPTSPSSFPVTAASADPPCLLPPWAGGCRELLSQHLVCSREGASCPSGILRWRRVCGSAFFFQTGFERVLPILTPPSLRPLPPTAPSRTTHTDGSPSERYRDSVRRPRG
jgi:hypothetical protein